MKKQMKSAFSLMEMMVVLLIISIIAAASAPMVTKKLARNVGGNESAWFYTGLNTNSIAYLPDNNASAMIGGTRVKDGTHPKLYIETSADEAAIGIGNRSNNTVLSLVADTRPYDAASNTGQRIGLTNATVRGNSIAIGLNQILNRNSLQFVAIGNGVELRAATTGVAVGPGTKIFQGLGVAVGNNATIVANRGVAVGNNVSTDAQQDIVIGNNNAPRNSNGGAILIGNDLAQEVGIVIGNNAASDDDRCIAIGNEAQANASSDAQHFGGSVAIGSGAQATGLASIAIGSNLRNFSAQSLSPRATQLNSMAIGAGAEASAINTVAIGAESKARHINSVAIGGGSTTAQNQIVLGTKSDIVYIPGHLVVDGDVILAHDSGRKVWFGGHDNNHFWLQGYVESKDRDSREDNSGESSKYSTLVSDRRLKNVGKKFTGGLEELKKLDLYHFTFKKDEKKTPHVGVMAQDLQKVFPDAVTTGDDGYLRIRWDEMFYALVNAVKELDNKIAEIAQQVKSTLDLVNKQQATIEAQQKTIDALVKQNAEFEKRLEKLEKAK